MESRSYALLTGLFIIFLGAALAAATLWLGNYGVERKPYLVTTQESVFGLNPESTVFYRGVDAGKVTQIRFDPENPRIILIRIEIDKSIPITQGTYATLRMQGITGLAQLALKDTGENFEPLPTDEAHPAHIPMRPSQLDRLAASGEDIVLQVEELISRLNGLLSDENRGRVNRILRAAETATENLIGLEQRMDQALAGLPALNAKAQRTLAHMDALIADLRDLSGQLEIFAQEAEALAASGKTAGDTLVQATLPRLNALLHDLHRTSGRISEFFTALERNPQALLFGPRPPPPGPGEPGYREPP